MDRSAESGRPGADREPQVTVPEGVLEPLAAVIAELLPDLTRVIPPSPAAELGRLGTVRSDRTDSPRTTALTARPPAMPLNRRSASPTANLVPRDGRPISAQVAHRAAGPIGRPGESAALTALRGVGPLLPERLLGALELSVADVVVDGPDRLIEGLPQPIRSGTFAFASASGESELVRSVRQLEQLAPGTTTLVLIVTEKLAALESLHPLLTPSADAEDEAAIAAAHGSAHLALAVLVSAAVLRQIQAPLVGTAPPAIIGAALAAAVQLLQRLPMPASYGQALLARKRAEYRLPRGAAGSIAVSDHQFGLAENAFLRGSTFEANGLVEPVNGGVAIRTGTGDGTVRVMLRVAEEPPPEVEVASWDEVVEVSWTASTGLASVLSAAGEPPHQLLEQTPPWPGDYRIRVHASGRDDSDQTESYLLVVWPAPTAPQVIHKRTDRLGHRLRGEPEPIAAPRPEAAFRWIRGSSLADAATITVVTGSAVDEVIRAFGADPAEPTSIREMRQDFGIAPWVTVLPVGDKVLAVEFNGWQGSTGPVIRALSRPGRAASMYWNVNALSRLSLAEHGEILAAFEPGLEQHPELPFFDGLDLADHRERRGKGLVVVERFTGHGITAEDLARIEEAGVAYAIATD